MAGSKNGRPGNSQHVLNIEYIDIRLFASQKSTFDLVLAEDGPKSNALNGSTLLLAVVLRMTYANQIPEVDLLGGGERGETARSPSCNQQLA
jgi:hypothetical protein